MNVRWSAPDLQHSLLEEIIYNLYQRVVSCFPPLRHSQQTPVFSDEQSVVATFVDCECPASRPNNSSFRCRNVTIPPVKWLAVMPSTAVPSTLHLTPAASIECTACCVSWTREVLRCSSVHTQRTHSSGTPFDTIPDGPWSLTLRREERALDGSTE